MVHRMANVVGNKPRNPKLRCWGTSISSRKQQLHRDEVGDLERLIIQTENYIVFMIY
jgi:hypothetical protein